MSGKVENPFTQEFEAQRYEMFRPKYHDIPFQELRTFIGEDFDSSLDVACGTGHATRAIEKISRKVVGCDASQAMLDEAKKNSYVEFLKAPAENLPFSDQAFDFLNISMAIHWVDQAQFLKEAHRVLKPSGHLSIDSYGYTGLMDGREDFKELYQHFDRLHYPPPTRNQFYPDDDFIKTFGFQLVKEFPFRHKVMMTSHQFANYLMSRSNHQVLSHRDQDKMPGILKAYYDPLFEGQEKSLLFKGMLKLYQKCQF